MNDRSTEETLNTDSIDQFPPTGKNHQTPSTESKRVDNDNASNVSDKIHAVIDNGDVSTIEVLTSSEKSIPVDSKQTKVQSSYAKIAKSELDKKLSFVPLAKDSDGEDIVVFDEVLVAEGASRWDKTAYGYLIGGNMPFGALQYILRKMWHKFGMKDISMDQNQICYFKFRSIEGMNEVIEKGPWIVNGKPLFVDKWNPDINIEKVEPNKLPLWVKLVNVPLKAWNTKGLSTIASKLGNPLVMDSMTASMCHNGVGRVSYARVMIEVEAAKGYPDHIDIRYKDSMNLTKGIKKVKVEYDWKPALCQHCAVFGHNHDVCKVRPRTSTELENKEKQKVVDEEGFEAVQAKKVIKNKVKQAPKQVYVPKVVAPQTVMKTPNKVWRLNNDKEKDLLASMNKYAVLSTSNDNCYTEDDVLDSSLQNDSHLRENEIRGIDPVIETHLKPSSTNKACSYIFGKLSWISNVQFSPNSCRIVIGWDNNVVNVMAIHVTAQGVNEHSSGCLAITDEMVEFNSCISDIEVEDLDSTGFHFTWTKLLKNPLCNVLRKLDRIMINESYVTRFPQAYGVFLPFLISDHIPAILGVPNGVVKKRSSFRFMNHIADRDDFLHTVALKWNCNVEGHKMFQVVTKLKSLKKDLHYLNWKHGDVFQKVVDLREKLRKCQSEVESNPHDHDTRVAATDTLLEFERFVKHFKNFLGVSVSCRSIDEFSDIFTNKLPAQDALEMVRAVTDEEIKTAIFDIDSNKAACPDGYSAHFFKKAWSIVGQDICLANREFFDTGKLLKQINTTLVALIPKIDNLHKVSEFRPIACCNVLYKCISKILTNRIKSGLDKIVSCNQSAFIPGRSIHDNILVAQEVLKGYNSAKGLVGVLSR
ncbi:uncharacterized protein [Rutidosis leptorrhynchoides]|uniref:uncharacterized protein n=1 Tax=Rutidosis leptorrhynchoides TaxID=125765 RepID=UPI003A9A62DA